ncbi:MAG: DinB family protein [Candidatus Eisenbacteria bacterium]|nr:DinB family protein [Candidatus Eisenbacteria bacterium]
MNAEVLAMLFGINHHVLGVNMKGITHEESLAQPPGAGNCINWVLGHIAQQRNSILRLLEEPAIWTEAESAPYIRGSKPMIDAGAAAPLEKILGAIDRSQERIVAALARTSPERLTAAGPDGTVAEKIAMLHFHEAYHLGQIGLLRRLLGKEGAIR